MPNLYFTRDPFAMIGNGVSINRMYSQTRNRETIYGEYIFKYHPDFVGTPEYYDRDVTFHIEGGDILNINEHVLAIGISQRTEPDAIDAIAHNIFNDETSPIDTILAFNIPVSRAFMHLDTVFTQIDRDKFTIHPGIMGPLTVFEIIPDGKGGTTIRERNEDLESVLWPSTSARRSRSSPAAAATASRPSASSGTTAPTPSASPRHRGGLSAQQRHQRRAVQERHQLSGHAVRGALPRPWRPALHVHAGLARGSVAASRQAAARLRGIGGGRALAGRTPFPGGRPSVCRHL